MTLATTGVTATGVAKPEQDAILVHVSLEVSQDRTQEIRRRSQHEMPDVLRDAVRCIIESTSGAATIFIPMTT